MKNFHSMPPPGIPGVEREPKKVIIAEILEFIAVNYIGPGYKIPDDILALKDEAWEVYSKLSSCTEEERPALEDRLTGIRDYLRENALNRI